MTYPLLRCVMENLVTKERYARIIRQHEADVLANQITESWPELSKEISDMEDEISKHPNCRVSREIMFDALRDWKQGIPEHDGTVRSLSENLTRSGALLGTTLVGYLEMLDGSKE